MRHESRGAGKGMRGLEERRKGSGIGRRVSERLEGAEIVGIRGKGVEKGDIIAVPFLSSNDHTDLAEDRILCFEIMAKAKSNWSILYPLTVSLEP